MKKTLLAILSVAMMLSVISCGTTAEAKKAGPKEVVLSDYGTTTPAELDMETETKLKDYAGKNLGVQVPEWIKKVASGNTSPSAFIDIIPDIEDKEVFVTTARGPNLDFVKEWTNLVDIEREVASIMQRAVAKALKASQEGSQTEGNTALSGETGKEINLEKAQETYQASMTNVILVGLKKTSDFWAKYIEIDNQGKIVDTYYDYFAIYTMPKDLYAEALDKARSQLPDATDQDARLKSILDAVLTQQMLGIDTVSALAAPLINE